MLIFLVRSRNMFDSMDPDALILTKRWLRVYLSVCIQLRGSENPTT